MKAVPTLIVLALVLLVCLPAAAGKYKKNKEKMKPVASPVEDKAGYDAATELDIKQVVAETTPEELVLTVEFWTAWVDVPEPQEAQVRLFLGKPGGRLFLRSGYRISYLDDGTVGTTTCNNAGTWNFDGKKGWAAVDDAVTAQLDGTTLTIHAPWTALPYEDLWLRVNCMHSMETVDEKTGETKTGFHGGASNPVPSDDCPNDGKALAVSRPAA